VSERSVQLLVDSAGIAALVSFPRTRAHDRNDAVKITHCVLLSCGMDQVSDHFVEAVIISELDCSASGFTPRSVESGN